MDNIYAFIQRRLFWLIILAIALGLGLMKITGGYNFSPILCVLAAFIMIYPSLVPLDFNRIGEVWKYRKMIAFSIFINFMVLPSLAILIGWLFWRDEPILRLGLILLSILPGGGMVTTWAYKSKADMPLTVGIVFANLLTAVILAPFYLTVAINKLAFLSSQSGAQSCVLEPVTSGAVSCLFKDSGSVSPLNIGIPMLIIIVIPLLLAYYTQIILKKKYSTVTFSALKEKFAALSNIGLLIVLFALMSIKENRIIFERPDILIKAVFPLIIFYVVSLVVSYLLYRRQPSAEGKALVWGTYLRYITLALGLAISLVYQDSKYSLAVIVIILAYLIQIPSSFWLAKIFNNVK